MSDRLNLTHQISAINAACEIISANEVSVRIHGWRQDEIDAVYIGLGAARATARMAEIQRGQGSRRLRSEGRGERMTDIRRLVYSEHGLIPLWQFRAMLWARGGIDRRELNEIAARELQWSIDESRRQKISLGPACQEFRHER